MSDGPIIVVDIGNSATKVGWSFEPPLQGKLLVPREVHKFTTGQMPADALADMLPNETCRWQIASVHREGTRLITEWLSAHRPADEVCLLNWRDFPITIRVDVPERVGLDRLAVAVAANQLRDPARPAVVVCAGSAITINLVAADGAFEGGVILPGFRMAAEALYGADLLPLTVLAPNDEPPPVIGKNTEAAIQSGLFWGAAGSVREIIQRISTQLQSEVEVFVTGGDLQRLSEHLGEQATFVPNLGLSGIAIAASQGGSPPGKN
jgi:type III pantothenate kinase